MRIATANGYDATMDNLNNRQAGLADLQEKLSAGKRVLRASDDPTAMAQAERAMNRIKRIETEQRILSGQKNAMALAESNLGDSIANLQAIRELVVAAGNGVYNTNDRTSLAQQMSALRDRLLNQSNAKDTNGIPLFGGLGSPDETFSDTAGGVTFKGTPGQKSSSLTSIPGALDGSAVWNRVPTGNGVFNASLNSVNIARSGASTLNSDPATVVNPSALTGNNYTITFSITGGVTQYSVPNSTPPIANADFIEGRPIQFDGISISPRGTPAAGDTISIGPVNTGTLYTDPGTVVNPSALTGNNYKITFSVAGGVTQYTVTKFNMATNPITSTSTTPVTFTSGQAIQFDGISITTKGNPADGDTLSVTPSTPVSLFTVLDNAINSINNSSNNNILRHALDKALSEIDAGMARLQSGRGRAGDMLNQADLIENNQVARTNQIQNDRSRAEDMDMVKGISDYQNQQTAYDAALKTYAQVQRLSLFNYMS